MVFVIRIQYTKRSPTRHTILYIKGEEYIRIVVKMVGVKKLLMLKRI